jgi:hypothetical protein
MAGRTDTVPAMLTPGEFVIKQESAAMLGEPFLRKLNAVSDNATQGFHAGGGVNQNSGAHGNIDALIEQAHYANMNPMYGGNIPMTPSSADFYDKGFMLPETDMGGESVAPYEAGTMPGDPTTDWLSKGLFNPQDLDEPRMTAPDLLKIIQENNKATDKRKRKEGIMGIAGAVGIAKLLNSIGFGRVINKKSGGAVGYENGGGVGEAGRQYPPGTLMSPFMGDTVSPQDATATTPFQSPEQAAEFDKMIKMLMVQAALQEAKQASEVGEAEKIEWDGKSILPPWQGKRNFKGNLYEEGIELPVYREGNQQIHLQ